MLISTESFNLPFKEEREIESRLEKLKINERLDHEEEIKITNK